MAGHEVLVRNQAIAVAEAIETTQRLLGEAGESERLQSAREDVAGRTSEAYVFSMLIAELTRVVAAQQERIASLEKAASQKTAKPASQAKA